MVLVTRRRTDPKKTCELQIEFGLSRAFAVPKPGRQHVLENYAVPGEQNKWYTEAANDSRHVFSVLFPGPDFFYGQFSVRF